VKRLLVLCHCWSAIVGQFCGIVHYWLIAIIPIVIDFSFTLWLCCYLWCADDGTMTNLEIWKLVRGIWIRAQRKITFKKAKTTRVKHTGCDKLVPAWQLFLTVEEASCKRCLHVTGSSTGVQVFCQYIIRIAHVTAKIYTLKATMTSTFHARKLHRPPGNNTIGLIRKFRKTNKLSQADSYHESHTISITPDW